LIAVGVAAMNGSTRPKLVNAIMKNERCANSPEMTFASFVAFQKARVDESSVADPACQSVVLVLICNMQM